MGLRVEQAKITRTTVETRNGAPGNACIVEGSGLGGSALKTQLYQQAGIMSRPPAGCREIIVGGANERIAIAVHNYRITIDIADGETSIYSTNAAGDTVMARIDLKADGTIEINGGSKAFVTHAELDTALQGFITLLNAEFAKKLDGGGTPGALSLDISTAATTTVKTGG